MFDTFLYGPPVPLAAFDPSKAAMGKVVPTGGAVVAAPAVAPEVETPTAVAPKKKAEVKAEPSMSWNFIYGRFPDSSVGPPCGVTHHQGSGTGPGRTIPGYKNGKPYVPGSTKSAPNPAVEIAVAQGNCAGDECQIG